MQGKSCFALSLVFAGSVVSAGAQAYSINLSFWNLVLPVDSNGNTEPDAGSNPAVILKPAAATPPWLSLNADGSLYFWCPLDGATTSPGSGSDHPRTELHQATSWMLTSTANKLTASLIIQQFPPAGDIIVGQIHGAGADASSPFVMLHAKSDGSVTAVVKETIAGDSPQVGDTYTMATGVHIGDQIDYLLEYLGNDDLKVSVSINGGTANIKHPYFAPRWENRSVIFAAGDYIQESGDSSTEGGAITFQSISINGH